MHLLNALNVNVVQSIFTLIQCTAIFSCLICSGSPGVGMRGSAYPCADVVPSHPPPPTTTGPRVTLSFTSCPARGSPTSRTPLTVHTPRTAAVDTRQVMLFLCAPPPPPLGSVDQADNKTKQDVLMLPSLRLRLEHLLSPLPRCPLPQLARGAEE